MQKLDEDMSVNDELKEELLMVYNSYKPELFTNRSKGANAASDSKQGTDSEEKEHSWTKKVASNSDFLHNKRQRVAHQTTNNIEDTKTALHLLSKRRKVISYPSLGCYKKNTEKGDALPTNEAKGKRRVAHTPKNLQKPVILPIAGGKVPSSIRQKCLDAFVDLHMVYTSNREEAHTKAMNDERQLTDGCPSKSIYLNRFSLAKMKLTTNGDSMRKESVSKQCDSAEFYQLLRRYIVSGDSLREHGYPLPVPNKPGAAQICQTASKTSIPVIQKSGARSCVCCRCGKEFLITQSGTYVQQDECLYHIGRVYTRKVSGDHIGRYSCCGSVEGEAGCAMAKNHVYSYYGDTSSGFVATIPSTKPNTGVFGLDCEMCYTVNGIELCRVTMIDHKCEVIYDSLVKPSSEVIDYNTRFSGIKPGDLDEIKVNLRQVQAILMSYIFKNSIIVGHGLENDLLALKLIHCNIVDTALIFPHRRGLPFKRALRNLAAEFLGQIIQSEDATGHDSKEDAVTCMKLTQWKIQDDRKKLKNEQVAL